MCSGRPAELRLGQSSHWLIPERGRGLSLLAFGKIRLRAADFHSSSIHRVDVVSTRCLLRQSAHFFAERDSAAEFFLSYFPVHGRLCTGNFVNLLLLLGLFFFGRRIWALLLFLCTPRLLAATMDLVWIAGLVVSVCARFVTAERHSVYWNSTNQK